MKIVKYSRNGTITIPTEMREKLNMKHGQDLIIQEWAGGLIIRPPSLIDKIDNWMKKEFDEVKREWQ